MNVFSQNVKSNKRNWQKILCASWDILRFKIKMINQGIIINCPVTVQDIQRSIQVYGEDIASLKGKITDTAPTIVNTNTLFNNTLIPTNQSMHCDIMFIDEDPYLVSVATPLDLVMVSHLNGSRSTQSLQSALDKQIAVFMARGYQIKAVLSDGEKGISKLVPYLNSRNIVTNIAAAGQHVPLVERKIRQIKERVRSILTTLPYNINHTLMKYLIYFVVSRINMVPTSTSSSFTSPREKFLDRKVTYTTDLRTSFGEYVQSTVPNTGGRKNDVHKPRTEGCIALYPSGNAQGSIYKYNLSTNAVVLQDRWISLPIPDLVINHLNK